MEVESFLLIFVLPCISEVEQAGSGNNGLWDISTGWTLTAASASASSLFLRKSFLSSPTHHECEHVLL